ncbi:MAG: radical SAM protein [Hyphomicrobiales bacterium]|nr:radical SAM protein [Hyphomicrobiales bacterium]
MAIGTKAQASAKRRFKLYLIKPSHYDDDGYVIQWMRSAIPSNTLAVLYGLARDCAERQVLGADVELDIVAFDETNTRIRPERISAALARNGGFGMVAFVGVQSNQFPHAMDIARKLRAAGAQVAMGGFHVSGCLAMLPQMPDDLQEAQALGISLFAGEAEDRLELVLRDAAAGSLRPLYDFMKDLPSIEAVPTPFLPAERIGRTGGRVTSFDAGRGCPFQCSFCTIINVQGRKSRYRTPDDVEAIVRANLEQGVRAFFITDDNLARNKNWEPIFDRLIEVRADTGVNFSIVIQVDTLCHRIPNFIEKAAKAGVRRVFLGLENINPDNLIAAKKKQNRIAEYRTMLLAWKAVGCFTYAGYILGFPNDTPSSIIRDIEIIQRELPLDLLEFFCLTPLPGSEDHQKLLKAGIPMDPDMNKYDLEHVTTGHPKMSKGEWESVYRKAWEVYYTPAHMQTIMRRAYATGISPGKMMFLLIWFYGCVTIEKIHPLEGGYLRRKVRRDRRPGMPIESPFLFYPKYLSELIAKHVKIASIVWRMSRTRRAIKRDPKARLYRDLALTPVADADLETLEMFQQNQSSRAAAAKAKLRAAAAA